MKTLTEAIRDGEASISEIDDWVERWHDLGANHPPLHKFLGLTWEQYAAWARNPDALKDDDFKTPR